MYYRDRAVLVAGSTGLVGMALTRRLSEMGARVRAVVHRLPPPVRYPGVDYVTADLMEWDDCRRVVEGIDHLFLAAANTSGAAAITATPLVHVTPNIILNALMLESAYHAKVKKVLWLSSSTGYPETGDRPVREDEMFEGHPVDVYFPVGWMKRYTEILCRMYSTKLSPPMCAQVVRPSNIYGPFDDFRWETAHVLPALIRKVVERHKPFEIWGTGDEVRDLIFVDDFADACLTVLERSDTYDPVNVGSGKSHSVREMAEMVCAVDGFEGAEIVLDRAKPRTILKRRVDVSKLEKRFGFRARTGLQEGIGKTIRWYRAHEAIVKR